MAFEGSLAETPFEAKGALYLRIACIFALAALDDLEGTGAFGATSG